MKSILVTALLLFSSAQAQADGFGPLFTMPLPEEQLTIHVVSYKDILANPGDTLRCLKSNDKFGYLITRVDNDYVIDVISNGQIEGEKSRMHATVKDYESPFIVYLSVFNRYGDFGSYFEILLYKKVNDFIGSLGGDVMFTEAYYTKEGDKEKETFKPIWKERVRCEMGQVE